MVQYYANPSHSEHVSFHSEQITAVARFPVDIKSYKNINFNAKKLIHSNRSFNYKTLI